MKLTGFDFETYPVLDNLPVPKAVCLTTYDGDRAEIIAGQEQMTARILELFNDAVDNGNEIVGINTRFDLAVATRLLMDNGHSPRPIFMALAKGRVHDCILNEKLMTLATQGYVPEHYGAAALAEKYLDQHLTGKSGLDAWRIRYNELEDTPLELWPRSAVDYAINDAIYAREVHLAQLQRQTPVNEATCITNASMQVAADYCFALMESHGMLVHEERAKALAAAWEKEFNALAEKLTKAGVLRPNGTLDTGVVRSLVNLAYGGRPPKTDKGNIKTDKETIEESPNPDARLQILIDYNRMVKNLSTYAKPVLDALDRSGTVHPSYNVLVKTGRTSCKDPNVQNQNRYSGIRECFIARPGCVLVGSDWNGQEDRSLTQVMVCQGLNPVSAGRYRRDPNFDPHSSVGVRLLNASHGLDLTYDEFRAVLKEKELWRALPEVVTLALVEFFRQLAKIGVFGLPGGMVAATLQAYGKGYGVELTMDQCKAIEAAWHADDPARTRYLARVKNRTRHGLASFTQVFTNRVRARCKYTELCNTAFQGLTADGAKTSLFFAVWGCYDQESKFGKWLFGARPWAFIHDEIVFECHEDICQRVAVGLQNAMDYGMGLYHPDVPCVNEPVIMDTFSKKAKSTRLPNGDLTIYRYVG